MPSRTSAASAITALASRWPGQVLSSSASSASSTRAASPTSPISARTSLLRWSGSRVAWMIRLPGGIFAANGLSVKLQPMPTMTSAAARKRATAARHGAGRRRRATADGSRETRSCRPGWSSPGSPSSRPGASVAARRGRSARPGRRRAAGAGPRRSAPPRASRPADRGRSACSALARSRAAPAVPRCTCRHGICTTTGPPRPLRRRVKARRMMLATSPGSVISSADLLTARITSAELKFGAIWACRRG